MRNRESGVIQEEVVHRNKRVGVEKEIVEEKTQEMESGYSEAQQALDIEMRSGDLGSLKKSKTFQDLTGNVKRLVAYRTITFRLKDLLIVYVGLLDQDPHRAQTLLTEILVLRDVQTYLFNQIIGKESIDIMEIPEELKAFLI